MTAKLLKAIIVGGGPVGLSTAILLKTVCGIDTEVYESNPNSPNGGAGMHIGQNGSRVYMDAGFGDIAKRFKACSPEAAYIHRYDGTFITTMQHHLEGSTSKYLCIIRRDLVDGLRTICKELDIPVHLHKTVVDVNTSGRLSFEDGSTATGDFIVGADGLNSVCRHLVDVSTDASLQKINATSDNAVIKASVLKNDPELADLRNKTNLWMGPRAHVVVFPVHDGELHALGSSRPDDGERDGWTAESNMESIKKHFTNWDPRLLKLMSNMEQGVKVGLMYRLPLSTWHRHRMVLVGDAAHPMLPFTGQGLSMGLEDIDMLCHPFKTVPDNDNLDARLDNIFTTFHKLRVPRTSAISSRALGSKDFFETADPKIMDERDAKSKAPESPQHVLPWKNPTARKGIFGYNAKEALATSM